MTAVPTDYAAMEVMSDIIKEDRVVWAIRSFQPYKSAGINAIISVVLQQSLDNIAPL